MRRTRQRMGEARGESFAQHGVASAAKRGRRDRDALLILLASVLVAYYSVFSAGFTNWDDDRFFTANPLFQGPVGRYVVAALTQVQFQAFHPLHLLSYLPDRLFWRDHPAGFHALNLALFACALVLGFRLLRRRVETWPALGAMLLVGLHPLAVESVAWAVGRKDILALLLTLAVLSVEDRATDTPGSGQDRAAGGQVRTRKSLAFALGLALLACLAKTSAVVLPIVLFAWLHFARRLPARAAMRRSLPFAAIALVFAVPVPLIWRHSQMIQPGRPLPLVLDVLGTLGVYARRALAPIDLSPVYPTFDPGQVLAGVAMGGALLLILAFWQHLPAAAKFAAVAFIGCLLPVANLTPLYFRFADRYALLALAMLAWPIAALLAWPKARKAGMVVVPVLLFLELWSTSRLVPVWKDSLSLWQHAVATQPRALFAHLKLGETFRAEGRFHEAAASYLQAGQIEPGGLKGPAGLLHTLGESAEADGRLPAGTTRQWEQTIGKPGFDAHQMATLLDSVEASDCHSCSEALLWLALRMFPQSDTSLVGFAGKALDRGRTATAMVYLGEIRNPNTEGLSEIIRRLSAPTK